MEIFSRDFRSMISFMLLPKRMISIPLKLLVSARRAAEIDKSKAIRGLNRLIEKKMIQKRDLGRGTKYEIV